MYGGGGGVFVCMTVCTNIYVCIHMMMMRIYLCVCVSVSVVECTVKCQKNGLVQEIVHEHMHRKKS